MQVHLSTSSSENVTDVLCVGLSFFFSLLSCFSSHKLLLSLCAETVNSFLQQLSELLSHFQGGIMVLWGWGTADSSHSCGSTTCSPWLLSKSSGWQSMGRAKTSEGQYSSALLRGQKCLCQAHRQTHCETHTQVCSVGIVWKSMCWLGQRDIRDQEWAIPGEKGEEEVD